MSPAETIAAICGVLVLLQAAVNYGYRKGIDKSIQDAITKFNGVPNRVTALEQSAHERENSRLRHDLRFEEELREIRHEIKELKTK